MATEDELYERIRDLENKYEFSITYEELLDKVIGHTGINCESNYDSESLQNLEKLRVIIFELINRLLENTKYQNRHEYSAQMICDKTKFILVEIKEQVDCYLEDTEII